MKKTKKGTYGYIRNERKRRLLITLASFAIPLIIYVTGYIQTKTRLNLFTFVAILGCNSITDNTEKYADLHFFYRNYKKFCEDEISAIGNWME